MINRHWRISGSTIVNSNFARLTPDQQSKKGAIWSRKALGVPSFSVVFKFRISGKGKVFFGDGIGFWITQQGYYVEGDLHGFQQKFNGIGVIFDTFKNTENLAAHRDVTVLVNDGEKTYEMMTLDIQGCNGNFRYHNERADFQVTDSSRAKIVVEDNTFTLSVDPKGSNEWVECSTIKNLPFPPDWARRAHLGITGTTGQLSDNHDVISLSTFSDAQVMEAHEAVSSSKKLYETAPEQPPEERLLRLEETVNAILEKLEVLQHHMEHHLVTLTDNHASLHSKVDELHELGGGKKDGDSTDAESRLSSLEGRIHDTLHGKLSNIENTLDKKIAKATSGSWRFIIFIVLLMLGGAGGGLFYFYQKLKKMHVL